MITKDKHPNPTEYMAESLQEIVSYAKNRRLIVSQKPEGRQVCLSYLEGCLNKAIALESGGLEGADVTEVLRGVSNIPATIPCDEDVEIYGTVVLPWKQYKIICEKKSISIFPDKLAKKIIDETACINGAKLELIVWHCSTISGMDSKQERYRQLVKWGFNTVNYRVLIPSANIKQIKSIQRVMNPFACEYPIGALVFEDNEQRSDLRCMSIKWPYDISAVYSLCAGQRDQRDQRDAESKRSAAYKISIMR